MAPLICYQGIRHRDGTRSVARIEIEVGLYPRPAQPGDVTITALREPHRISSDPGFDWGDANEQAADLAYAILLDLVGPESAGDYAAQFLADVVSQLEGSFRLTAHQVNEWLQTQPVGGHR